MSMAVGVDIVFLPDFAKAMKKKGFAKRIFTPKEIRWCESKAFPLQHFAARFAAKEAVFKALGKPVSYLKTEITTLSSGKPVASLKQGGMTCGISMAHVKDYAVAFVICQKS